MPIREYEYFLQSLLRRIRIRLPRFLLILESANKSACCSKCLVQNEEDLSRDPLQQSSPPSSAEVRPI